MFRHALARAGCLFALALFGCGGSGPRLLAVGDPCLPEVQGDGVSPQCSSNLCIALDNQSGFCTQNCDDDSNCPDEFVCQGAGRYGKICRTLKGCKIDSDCPSGHSCNAETGNCYIKVSRTLCSPCQDTAQCPQGGYCFNAVGSGEQFCTSACGAGDACPAGFKCDSIPAGKDGAKVKQCVPQTESCNAGRELCTACRGDNECGGPFDLCVRNVISGEQFCGRDCNPKKNVCKTPGCVPEQLDSAPNPDCPTNFTCTNIGKGSDPNLVGPFQCVPNSNTCANFCDATGEQGQLRQCGLGKTCTNNSCQPSTDGRMCSPCLTNDDCRKSSHPENRCIVNDCPNCPFKGESFCSTPCTNDAACVTSFGLGFVCKPVADTSGLMRSYCMPQRGTCATGLGRLGDSCAAKGAQDCVTGTCIQAGNQAVCSVTCAKDGDCGDTRYRCCESMASGWDCSPAKRTADGPASGSGVCAPLGGLFGDDCAPGRPPCQSGTCLDLGTARLCTQACPNGGSCPDGFSCRKATLQSASGQFDVCFPFGGGEPGADCAFGPAACASGLCIRKDSGPICSAACTQDTDCPTDWSCQPRSTVDMKSVSACIPPALQ